MNKIDSNKIDKEMQIGVIIKRTIAAGVAVGFFLLLFEDRISLLLGLVFGLVFSLLNFRLLQLTIEKSVKMSEKKAQSYVTQRYFLRYAITGVVLYVAITNPSLNVLGTIAGLILLKFVILVSNAAIAIKKQ